MRASVLRDGRMVYRDDVPDPVPEIGQVLVAIRACGICGTDLHFAAHGDRVLEMTERVARGSSGMDVDLKHDVFMGHEFSAEVLEAGPDTDTHPAGTIVTSIPVLLSAKGVEPIVYSNNTIGGYAERMLLSALLLLPVPNGLDLKHAALTEPMAVGLHAVNKSNIAPGETALVLGCGPIGIAIIASLRARGVENIVASDFSPKRRELASAMGAHQTLDAAQGSPFDSVKAAVVFEAIGVPGLIDGGSITVPTFRMYNPDGTWFKEGHGVDPDIAVPENLTAAAHGKDAQLERAISEINELLKQKGLTQPARPAAEIR